MNKKNVNKRKRYYFICSILTSIVFLAIGAYTIYAAIPSPGHGTSDLEGDASLNMNSNKIINLSTPTADTDAATKAYVDAAGGATIYEVCCAWRYDYREGVVGTGEATNWSCTPAACYSGYTSLGISTIPSGVSCSGNAFCRFDYTDRDYHPVSVGRSCRLCAL